MTAAAARAPTPGNEVLQAAREFTRRGRRVVPVPRGEKAPRLQGWQKARLSENELPRHFKEGVNIGVLCGEPSGGLIDVDCDVPEAAVAASVFLPTTALVHGRPSKPRSHFWYRCDPIPNAAKFQDIDGTSLIEVRSSGQQTIVPPSVHPSGERISWVNEGEPARLSAEALRSAVTRIAAAAILARHWPRQGSRHEASKALAGLLMRSGWDEEEAMRFVATVAQLAGDEEYRGRSADVRTTARRLAEGGPATGRTRLEELLGKPVVSRVCDWLALRFAGNGGANAQDVPELHREIRAVVLHEGTPAFDKRRDIARLIEVEFSRRGKFLRTSDGRAFFFHGEERRLFDLQQTAFQHLLTAISGLSATEAFFKFALDVLQAKVTREAPLSEVLSFAHFDDSTGLLAVSDGAGGIWLRERGGSWMFAHNGDHGLLFLTEPEAVQWVPEFKDAERARAWFLGQFLFSTTRLPLADSQTLLYVWLAQQFFPRLQRTRMIPTFLGPQGSGKTTGERLVGRLLLGPTFDVMGLQRDREDGFVAAVTNSVILGIDNADSKIPWLEDSLALYATGQRYRLRCLYKTNELVSYAPRAILMISSRDPRFNRPDVTERLLPFYFERPPTYRTELEIFRDLESRRGAIIGALLNHAGAIADGLHDNPSQPLAFRMAEFASFGARVFHPLGKSEDWIRLLDRLEQIQAEFASSGDGLIIALAELLSRAGGSIELSTGELFKRCAAIAEAKGLLFPRTAQGFGRRLSTMRRVIELQLGVTIQESTGHERFVSFRSRDRGDGGDTRAKVF